MLAALEMINRLVDFGHSGVQRAKRLQNSPKVFPIVSVPDLLPGTVDAGGEVIDIILDRFVQVGTRCACQFPVALPWAQGV